MFKLGELVVCVDASDLPEQWLPLVNGKIYIIRGIDPIPEGTNFKHNMHKQAKYLLYLEGLVNITHPVHGKELGYADSRFEKIDSDKDKHISKNKIESKA